MILNIKNILLIIILIFKNYSLLRILQIIEVKKIDIKGRCVEFGAYEDLKKNFIYWIKNKKIKIYLTNLKKKKKIIYSDLRKRINFKSNYFDNILIFNVLEHINKNDNAFKELKRILKKKGKIIGSTPFIYQVHGAPEDYFRFTKTFFEKKLSDSGFEIEMIKCLGQGPFVASSSLIYSYTRYIPFLSHFVLLFCSILDLTIQIFVKTKLSELYPVGILFIAKKK